MQNIQAKANKNLPGLDLSTPWAAAQKAALVYSNVTAGEGQHSNLSIGIRERFVNEIVMEPSEQKIILYLEKLNELNAEGCPACKGKFTLGETVVLACGPWEDMKYIHENEAVFDKKTAMYYERRCYQAPK